MTTQPPPVLYEIKAAAEALMHRQRRNGENPGDAKLLLGAVTCLIRIVMLLGESERRHGKTFGRGSPGQTPGR